MAAWRPGGAGRRTGTPRPPAPRSSVKVRRSSEFSQRVQTADAVRPARAGFDIGRAKLHAVLELVALGLDDPAHEYRNTIFQRPAGGIGQPENDSIALGAGELAGEKMLMALAGLPGDPVQGIALAPVAQAVELVAFVAGAVAAVGPAGREKRRRLVGGPGPDQYPVLGPEPAPGFEPAQRMTRAQPDPRNFHPAAIAGRYRQYGLVAGGGRKIDACGRRQPLAFDHQSAPRPVPGIAQGNRKLERIAGESLTGHASGHANAVEIAVRDVHRQKPDAGDQKRREQPEVVVEIETAQQHREQQQADQPAEPGRQDVDLPVAQGQRWMYRSAPPKPGGEADLDGVKPRSGPAPVRERGVRRGSARRRQAALRAAGRPAPAMPPQQRRARTCRRADPRRTPRSLTGAGPERGLTPSRSASPPGFGGADRYIHR